MSPAPADPDAFAARVDPQVRAVLDTIPRLDLSDLPTARREREALALLAVAGRTPPPGVETRDMGVPGRDGEPEVRLRVHTPREGTVGPVPVLLWVHGGGHVMGAAAQDDPMLQDLVERTRCVAVAVEWRRSPEFPYPAALHDCVAAYRWLADPGSQVLGVDPGRLVVGGASSGGGLAAGVVLALRDAGDVRPRGQLLVYPMLDDRELTASSREITDRRVWNHESNRLGWSAYLGALASDDVPAYAAPARATVLAGLPPTWVATGDLDLFRDEDIAYAASLAASGVPTELHVYPGAVHGFDLFAPFADVSRRFRRERDDAFDRFLQGPRPDLAEGP
jgi:acetyl esterase/lipase